MSVVINGSAGVTTNSGAVYNGISAGTAVASTSGTSIDFTSIPSWVKRITVMFQGVSTNGTSNIQIQLGDSGGIENTGYSGSYSNNATASSGTILYSGAGFMLGANVASTAYSGSVVLTNISSNTWVAQGLVAGRNTLYMWITAGDKSLSDVLNQLRVTTVNGTDTFDAGSINILYE